MNRCPGGDFYVVATWYPKDPERYLELSLYGGGYDDTIRLTKRISRDGHDGLGKPHSIRIEAIDKN